MDDLDKKLNEAFEGKVVRKDLLHRIKKGTNVPTFVLEFLLSRYCASDDDVEIQAGLEAVLETLDRNYVRPDEANAAQSRVATVGKHKFIDKVHVRYIEKDRRHWAALENFASQRIAVGESIYRNNDRLLEGGIWAEVTVAHNDVDADSYAFYIEDLRPIQLSRFDFDEYAEGRQTFSRDEWMDSLLRSVGLEPSKLNDRQKMHFMLRLAPLVEKNFNFIELGPRSTGKSYFYSEFSPYSTLISGGQATKAVLFYNNARGRIGLVGFWDVVAFDEVGGIKVKDPDTMQIMKDFMANGRFSRGVEVIADASLAFVGNIDDSVEKLVNSTEHDLFVSLPPQFDLAVMDRFAAYLPGWEMPKTSNEFLTNSYGLITDYVAEAFHYQLKHESRYEEVASRIKLGASIEGRDEKGIIKTVAALLKLLHPGGKPSDEEFDDYCEYAVEQRRRVKEQMNKRKPDDEYANIGLSFFRADGSECVVYCPESKHAKATQDPSRGSEGDSPEAQLDRKVQDSRKSDLPPGNLESENGGQARKTLSLKETSSTAQEDQTEVPAEVDEEPTEQHFRIRYGDTGHTYDSILSPYLRKAKEIHVEDPYIRAPHQVANFVRFCEAVIKQPTIQRIQLVTGEPEHDRMQDVASKLADLKQSLLERDVQLDIKVSKELHDREIRIDNGWIIKIGRGLDFYQRPDSFYAVGANDFSLRSCLETSVDIFRED